MAQDFPSHLIKHFFSIGNETKPNDHFFGQFSPDTAPASALDSEHQAELSAINQEVLSHLKTIVPELKFKTYFENSLELLEIEGQSATFSVRTSFIRSQLNSIKKKSPKHFLMFWEPIIRFLSRLKTREQISLRPLDLEAFKLKKKIDLNQ